MLRHHATLLGEREQAVSRRGQAGAERRTFFFQSVAYSVATRVGLGPVEEPKKPARDGIHVQRHESDDDDDGSTEQISHHKAPRRRAREVGATAESGFDDIQLNARRNKGRTSWRVSAYQPSLPIVESGTRGGHWTRPEQLLCASPCQSRPLRVRSRADAGGGSLTSKVRTAFDPKLGVEGRASIAVSRGAVVLQPGRMNAGRRGTSLERGCV